jgi:hypothetical protein
MRAQRGAACSSFAHNLRIVSVSNLVGSATTVCALRRVRLAANGGELMWGGLRRPLGPFQVTCVLAEAGLAAAFSTSPIDAQQGWGTLPMSGTPKRGRSGRCIDASTVAVVSVRLS